MRGVIFTALTAAVAANAQSEPLPAPTLALNATRSAMISWQPSATAAGFDVKLSVSRRSAPTFHITRRVVAGVHELVWADLPENAGYCFRVAPAGGASAPVPAAYSDATCYSSYSCAASELPPPPRSCGAWFWWGALFGTVLCAAAVVAVTRAGYLGRVASLVRGIGGGSYAHVTTADGGFELGLEASGEELCRDAGRHGAHGGGAAAPLLEPPPDINAADFELRWSSCASCSRVLVSALPSLPPSAPDEIELALTEAGFFCVAAGAVGGVHKFYFTAQLAGTSDWLMLELVLYFDASSAQATFRCDAPQPGRLAALSEQHASLLNRIARTSFAPA